MGIEDNDSAVFGMTPDQLQQLMLARGDRDREGLGFLGSKDPWQIREEGREYIFLHCINVPGQIDEGVANFPPNSYQILPMETMFLRASRRGLRHGWESGGEPPERLSLAKRAVSGEFVELERQFAMVHFFYFWDEQIRSLAGDSDLTLESLKRRRMRENVGFFQTLADMGPTFEGEPRFERKVATALRTLDAATSGDIPYLSPYFAMDANYGARMMIVGEMLSQVAALKGAQELERISYLWRESPSDQFRNLGFFMSKEALVQGADDLQFQRFGRDMPEDARHNLEALMRDGKVPGIPDVRYFMAEILNDPSLTDDLNAVWLAWKIFEALRKPPEKAMRETAKSVEPGSELALDGVPADGSVKVVKVDTGLETDVAGDMKAVARYAAERQAQRFVGIRNLVMRWPDTLSSIDAFLIFSREVDLEEEIKWGERYVIGKINEENHKRLVEGKEVLTAKEIEDRGWAPLDPDLREGIGLSRGLGKRERKKVEGRLGKIYLSESRREAGQEPLGDDVLGACLGGDIQTISFKDLFFGPEAMIDGRPVIFSDINWRLMFQEQSANYMDKILTTKDIWGTKRLWKMVQPPRDDWGFSWDLAALYRGKFKATTHPRETVQEMVDIFVQRDLLNRYAKPMEIQMILGVYLKERVGYEETDLFGKACMAGLAGLSIRVGIKPNEEEIAGWIIDWEESKGIKPGTRRSIRTLEGGIDKGKLEERMYTPAVQNMFPESGAAEEREVGEKVLMRPARLMRLFEDLIRANVFHEATTRREKYQLAILYKIMAFTAETGIFLRPRDYYMLLETAHGEIPRGDSALLEEGEKEEGESEEGYEGVQVLSELALRSRVGRTLTGIARECYSPYGVIGSEKDWEKFRKFKPPMSEAVRKRLGYSPDDLVFEEKNPYDPVVNLKK